MERELARRKIHLLACELDGVCIDCAPFDSKMLARADNTYYGMGIVMPRTSGVEVYMPRKDSLLSRNFFSSKELQETKKDGGKITVKNELCQISFLFTNDCLLKAGDPLEESGEFVVCGPLFSPEGVIQRETKIVASGLIIKPTINNQQGVRK